MKLPLLLIFPIIVASRVLSAGIEAVAPEWNFGSVESGTTITNVFVLRNTATGPLALASVKSSCSCTTADWPKTVIPPGSSACLRVALKLPAEEGPVHKLVTAAWQAQAGTNSGKTGETVLTLKGEARSLIWLTPSAANLGVCRRGTEADTVLTAHALRGMAQVLKAECSVDGFRAEQEGGTVRVRADTLSAGTRRGLIRVRLSDGTISRDLEVPAFVHVQLPLSVFPERLAAKAGVTSAAMVRSAFGETFKILACEAPKGVTTEAQQLTPTNWRIDVTVQAGQAVSGGCVVVKTDLASMPEVRIELVAP